MKSNLTICFVLVALTLAAFFGVTKCDFVHYDDQVFVLENPHVLGGFTVENVKWAFTTSAPDYWRPLSWLSHQLDVELFKLNPLGHHLTNLLFHIGATLLLFLALRMMTAVVWPSAFVAALFAVHPLHVESVAWVAERKDVLNGFFWMLTLLAYAHYAREPNVRRYLLVTGAFVLCLMSKPMAVTLPCVLLLLDFWPLKRMGIPIAPEASAGRAAMSPPRREPERRTETGNASPRRAEDSVALPSLSSDAPALSLGRAMRLFAEKLPLFLLAGVVSGLAIYGQVKVGVLASAETIPLPARLGNALVAYVQYLRKTIWPADLAVFYPHPGQWPLAHVALAAAFLAIVTAWTLREWRRQPFLLTGWLWFLGTLVPTVGIVQVGAQAMADRYTYIPLIGVFMMVAWATQDWLAQRTRLIRPVTIVGVTIVLACGIVANRQVRHWRNTYTLFEHALAVAPESALARMQFGESLNRLQQFEQAEQQLARAVALAPNWKLARFNYAMTLLNRGKSREAIEQLQAAVRLAPDFALAHFELAAVFTELGRPANAVPHYREGLRLQPNSIEALNNLAWTLATHPDDRVRRGAEAVSLAERACALTRWEQPALIGTLAAAYAEAGRFNDAITTAEKAKALAESKGDAALASKNASLLELYRAGKPYRDAPAAEKQP